MNSGICYKLTPLNLVFLRNFLCLSEVTSELKICRLALQLQTLENQVSFKWKHILAI